MKTKSILVLALVILVLVTHWASQSAFASGLVHSTANLSQGRYWLAATTVGNKAMFAGGDYASLTASNVVDIYNADTDTWSTARLSQSRRELSATTVGNKALFAGGYYYSGGTNYYSNVVDIYNINTNTWSTATLSLKRDTLSATSVGNKALFAGGSNGFASKVVDIYNAETNTWSTASLSQARSQLVATTVGNKAMFAGGGAYSNVVDIYDSDTDTWSTATLSQGRTNLAATTVGGKAFFAGGRIVGGKSNVVDIYNADTDTWSTATLSQGRSNLVATTVGNKAIFGGGQAQPELSDVVDIYDADTDTWSTTTLSVARAYLCATTVGTKGIFAGGLADAGAISRRVDIYTITTPPVADAGSDQNVMDADDNGSEVVNLDGSGSMDSDGTIQSYVWSKDGTQIATGVHPTVTLLVGTHTITLTVTDDDGLTNTDTVTITIEAYPNQPPIANAGSDQTVTDADDNSSEQVTLDGSGSSDSDGTIGSWVWTDDLGDTIPDGEITTATLSIGTHTITLTVTDNDGLTATDTVTVTVEPYPNQPHVCPEPIPGDLSGDCKVDFEDFAILASDWLKDGNVPVSIAKIELNSNPGWTTQGQWQFGIPMGMGGSSHGYPDPNAAYTGLNVYGVNLNGDYTVAVGGPYTLTAGPFDCNSYETVELSFARWLNTDTADYVQCKVEASNDGSAWQTVWLNPTTAPITDNQWQVVDYDISQIAAGYSQVYIRWSYQILDGRAYPYSGWNVDDIELLGKSMGHERVGCTNLDMPGASSTEIYDIDGNNIVGDYYIDGSWHGFLYKGSTWTTIVKSGATHTQIYGIDGNNLVGSYSYTSNNTTHGFLFNGSTWATIDYPGARYTWIYGIDENNLVGSYYDDASGKTHGFIYNGTTWTTIDLPGAIYTQMSGINGNSLVGRYADANYNVHGFLYNGTTWTTIDYPGAVEDTEVWDIDGNNLVGSYYDDASGNSHGFLYNGTTWTTIDVPGAGATSTYAYGISGSNLVGTYYDDSGSHGFIYTIPESVQSPVCLEQIPGDLNGDCVVDFEDFAILASHWLQRSYEIIANFTLDTNPNWTTEGQWQFGTPMGMGGSSHGYPDPNAAYTGLNVYGVNLNGDYTVAVGGPYRLTAGPFDCNGYENVELNFARWLNTDTSVYVKCMVEVSNNGSEWQEIWSNPVDVETADNQWQQQHFDISSIADRQANVYVRWSYQILDGRAYPYSGWNIDDINLQGRISTPILNGMTWVSISDPGVSGHEGFSGRMSKYEITNAQYCQFLNAAKASNQITVYNDVVYAASDTSHSQPYFSTEATNSNSQITYSGNIFSVRIRDGYSMGNHPVVMVSWYGATAFCNYYGYRLPTEWEWQAVADYDGSFNYGCGTSIDSGKANYTLNNPLGLTSYPYTSLVGYYPAYGYGMCDMAGNVDEWTSTVRISGCVICGGDWYNDGNLCAVSSRCDAYPYVSDRLTGFRVCR